MIVRDKGLEMLRLLHVHVNVINDFKRKNRIYRSEAPCGFLYWLSEEEQEIVNNFEKENQDCLVYHVIKTTNKDFEIVYDLLYVTDDELYMKEAKENLTKNLVLSHTITQFPESGPIKVKEINGGLIREY